MFDPFHHHKHSENDACGCNCCPPGRHFLTKKEKKEKLEQYKDKLKNELEGVEETISNLSSDK